MLLRTLGVLCGLALPLAAMPGAVPREETKNSAVAVSHDASSSFATPYIMSTIFTANKVASLSLATSFAPSFSSAPTTIPYQLKNPPLDTPWTGKVGTSPWPSHPRPLLLREPWKTLNGLWTYRAANNSQDINNHPPPGPLDQEVLIPSCVESGLSGIMQAGVAYMWFRTAFSVPDGWEKTGGGGDGGGNRVLLNFEAVDYKATVFLNGVKVGSNRGGYFRFTIDITDALLQDRDGTNELLVFVFDPTDGAPYFVANGKQTLEPSHIFYTPCSGIWQSVWMESVPAEHITEVELSAGMHGTVNVTVHSSEKSSLPVEICLYDRPGHSIASHRGMSNDPFSFTVSPTPKLWTPDSPTLYNVTVTMGNDKVRSYTAFRTVSRRRVNGVERPTLNDEPVFLFGPLDQGYWPDGIYTPPTLDGMMFDLKLIKALGMNMVRKHIKIEPALWYQACDQLGLMVIQDMPSMRQGSIANLPNATHQAEWERQFGVMIKQQKGFPCIIAWVIYNEGWGQMTAPYYPEFGIADRIRDVDPTRIIDATTGWFDHGAGDFSDNHHYAEPQCGTPFYSLNSAPFDPRRIGFQGEFGGVGHKPPMEK